MKKITQYVVMIIVIMIGIFAVKKLSAKFNIPVLSNISQEV